MNIRKRLLKSAIAITLTFLLALTVCSCEFNGVTPKMRKIRKELASDWTCDEFTLVPPQRQFELSIDGKVYLCERRTENTPYLLICDYNKRVTESNKRINNLGDEEYPYVLDAQIWRMKIELKDGLLHLTIVSDYLFERGETTVDHTGMKFVLTKVEDENNDSASQMN